MGIKTSAAIEAVREAGRVVATALAAVQDAARVGVSLQSLDEAARAVLGDAGARSPFLGIARRSSPCRSRR